MRYHRLSLSYVLVHPGLLKRPQSFAYWFEEPKAGWQWLALAGSALSSLVRDFLDLCGGANAG